MLEKAIPSLIFYIFAAASILLSIGVVTSRRILRAGTFLMLVLSLSAGFYLLLGAEFLAGVQVLVYVGGIVVLIVFAVMLTRPVELLEDLPTMVRRTVGLVAALAFGGFSLFALYTSEFPAFNVQATGESDVVLLGRHLLDYGADGYVLPFEVISLLLLAAVIGAIVIARRRLPGDVEVETRNQQGDLS